jgi:hypothetical protein
MLLLKKIEGKRKIEIDKICLGVAISGTNKISPHGHDYLNREFEIYSVTPLITLSLMQK